MSLWELAACIEGWKKAKGVEEKPAAPSAEEHLAMVDRVLASRAMH